MCTREYPIRTDVGYLTKISFKLTTIDHSVNSLKKGVNTHLKTVIAFYYVLKKTNVFFFICIYVPRNMLSKKFKILKRSINKKKIKNNKICDFNPYVPCSLPCGLLL